MSVTYTGAAGQYFLCLIKIKCFVSPKLFPWTHQYARPATLSSGGARKTLDKSCCHLTSFAIHAEQCMIDTANCTLYILHFTIHPINCTMNTSPCTINDDHFSLCTLYWTQILNHIHQKLYFPQKFCYQDKLIWKRKKKTDKGEWCFWQSISIIEPKSEHQLLLCAKTKHLMKQIYIMKNNSCAHYF